MGRMVANKGNGDCISTTAPMTGAPMPIDIVLVPSGPAVVPTPCVNTAKLADAAMTVDEVNVNGKPVVVRRSQIPLSSGAPSNAIKGIISPPPANNRCNFLTSSATVFAGGYPLERHRDVTIQNAGNCPGGVKLKEAFSLHGSGLAIDPAMTPAQQEAIVQNLEELNERPRTKELLDTIKNNYQSRVNAGQPGQLITVSANSPAGVAVAAGDAACVPNVFANGLNGTGTPSWIQFNPTQSLNVPGYSETMSPELVLAHELVHSMHASSGTLLNGHSAGTLPNGNPAPSAMHNAEQQAMGIGTESNSKLAESRFAEERGMSVRKTHGPSEGYFPFNPNPANVAPVGFATGAGGEHFVYCNK